MVNKEFRDLKDQVDCNRIVTEQRLDKLNENLIQFKTETYKKIDNFMEALKIVKSDTDSKMSRAMSMAIFSLMCSVFCASFYILRDDIKEFRKESQVAINNVETYQKELSDDMNDIKIQIKGLHALDQMLKNSEIIYEK